MTNQPDSERQPAVEKATKSPIARRRPYAKPQLVEYGSVAKLTRGTRSGTGEITPLIEKRKCL